MTTKKILVLCTGNSARSQMGEGLFRAEGGAGIEVFSAGTKPSAVRPEAITVMNEIGIDISGQRSKSVDEFSGQVFDYVVTVCDNAHESCPLLPGKAQVIHVGFDDPPRLAADAKTEDERLAPYRRVRDEIRAFVETLPNSLEQQQNQ